MIENAEPNLGGGAPEGTPQNRLDQRDSAANCPRDGIAAPERPGSDGEPFSPKRDIQTKAQNPAVSAPSAGKIPQAPSVGGGAVGGKPTIYHGTPMTPRAALLDVLAGRAACVSFWRPDVTTLSKRCYSTPKIPA